MEKTAAERQAVVEKGQEKTEAKADAKPDTKSPDAKSADAKSADVKPADAKSDVKSAESPADDQRRQATAPREKEKIRVILASPVQAVNPPAPVAAVAPAAPVETAVAPDERRDANDLARAAIERLRANGETSPRAPETARAHETPKATTAVAPAPVVATAPVVVNAPAVTVANAPAAANAPALRPLPPPIMVSGAPAAEPHGQAPSQARPPYAEAVDRNRPIRRPRFRSHARSICVPKRRSPPCANAPRRPPRTRCRPPSRSSTPSCRNNSAHSVQAKACPGLDPGGFRFA